MGKMNAIWWMPKKKCIQVNILVNVAQAAIHNNQKCLDTDGNHFEHHL